MSHPRSQPPRPPRRPHRAGPPAPRVITLLRDRQPQLALALLLLALALAWACGGGKTKLYDRDISLSDAPLDRNIAREPLTGALLDGYNALRRGALDDAREALLRHLKANPRSAAAHYHLGLIAMDQDAFERARRHLQQAATLEPHLYGAWSNLGVLYLRHGEEAAAVKALERAAGLAPKNPRVLNNLANAWLRRGRWSAALDAYDRALSYAGEHGTLRYNKALALTQRYQYAEAEALLKLVLANRPGFVLGRALRVVCMQGQGRVAEAIAQGRKDLTLIEALPESHVVLGRALLANGEVEAGLAELKEAVELEDTHPIAVMTWAEALDAAGRRKEAQLWYGRYLKLDDRRFEDTRRIRRRLRKLRKSSGRG